MAYVCLFRTCDQILRINSIDVSHADKATILHLLHSATKPLRLVSSVVGAIVMVIYVMRACVCVHACGRTRECLPITCGYCVNTAKCCITQTMPHDSPGILVFWCWKSCQN